MRQLSVITGFCLLLVLATGCNTDRLLVPEVLQQPVDSAVYTKHNLWYIPGGVMTSANIQQGELLPAGTKIEVVTANQEEVCFKDGSGRLFRLTFDQGERLTSMREYIRQIFTLETPSELFANIPTEIVGKIESGEIVKGMSKREVTLAYGVPSPLRTPNLKNTTWYYQLDKEHGVRVVFRGGKVRDILKLD